MTHPQPGTRLGTVRPGARVLSSRPPGWLLAVGVYLLTRGWVWVITVLAARGQTENLWTQASPGYSEFITMWDGDRYRQIAEQGYPLPFPVDANQQPTQSEWAFYPAYPILVRLVMLCTGADFAVAGPVVAFAAGLVAVALAYQLFRDRAGRGSALAAVGLLGLFPTAPVLQYGYSESTCLLGLTGTLLMVQRRRYGMAMPFVVLLCLSRPIGAAIGPVLAIVFAVRWVRARAHPTRSADRPGRARPGSFPHAERLLLGALMAVAALATAAFPALVAWASGRWDGYTAVQVAWRVSDRMEYFTPWLWMARYVFGDLGPALLAVGVALVLVLLASPPVRDLGLVMWSWCAVYIGYLAAVLDPFTSLPRFVLMLFPLALAVPLAAPAGRRRAVLVGVVGLAFAVGQWWWVGQLWVFSPPSDYPP